MLRFLLFLVLILLTVFRFVAANQNLVTSEEAYLYLLGLKWDWANMTGPGGLPSVFHLLSRLFGPSPAAIHWLSPIALFFSTLGIYTLGRTLQGEAVGVLSAVAWSVLPINNILSLQASDSMFLAACWTWFLTFIWQAVYRFKDTRTHSDNPTKPSYLFFPLCGCILAMGSFFSYWMLLTLPSILLWAVFSRKLREAFSHAGIYLMFGISLIGVAGPFYWNQQTGWIAFAQNTLQTFVYPNPDITFYQVSYFFNATGFLIGLGLLISLIFAIYLHQQQSQAGFALSFAFIPLLCILHALYRGTDITAPVLLFCPPLLTLAAALVLDPRIAELDRLSQSLLKNGLLTVLCITAIQSLISLYRFHPSQYEPDWAPLNTCIDRQIQMQAPHFEKPLLLIASNSKLAAILGFYRLSTQQNSEHPKDFPPVFVRESQDIRSQFNLWNRYDEFIDSNEVTDELFTEQKGVNPYLHRSALYIGREPRELLPQTIDNGFAEVIPLEHIHLPLPNGNYDDYYIYLCIDYLTAPL